MKKFDQREIREALAYAEDQGGQAVHLISGTFAYLRPTTPKCFKGQRVIAHLFDRDKARLIGTARKLGVRVIKVEREGTDRQHIDLCGQPLVRALAKCEEDEQTEMTL